MHPDETPLLFIFLITFFLLFSLIVIFLSIFSAINISYQRQLLGKSTNK